jgi:hypothetical protein
MDISFPESPSGVGFSLECVSPIPTAIVAALLLFYPIRTEQVHPLIQILICACLTAVGLSLGLSRLVCESVPGECSSCTHWVMATSIILSLSTVIVPAVGAIFGLGTACGLLMNALVTNFCSQTVTDVLVLIAAFIGTASLFSSKEIFMWWQLFAPPIVGGYLAAISCGTNDNMIRYTVWTSLTLVSVFLHIRRRRVNSWLEEKQRLAVHSKESQIVYAMRSANPNMQPDEFEKMKEKLLQVVDGDREQVDRIVFGGGLY